MASTKVRFAAYAIVAAALCGNWAIAETSLDSHQGGDRAQKTAEREQILAELDDANALIRVGALEDILGGQDGVLVSFAKKKIFSGTDQQLQSMLIIHALSEQNRTFTMLVGQCKDSDPNHRDGQQCQTLVNGLSGAITLAFSSFNKTTGSFNVLSPPVASHQSHPVTYDGKVIGNHMTFHLNLVGITNSINASDSENCSAQFSLSSQGAMDGYVRCGSFTFLGAFEIS